MLTGLRGLCSRGAAEQGVAADGAGMMAFRGMKSLQPAPLLNFSVELNREARWLSLILSLIVV